VGFTGENHAWWEKKTESGARATRTALLDRGSWAHINLLRWKREEVLPFGSGDGGTLKDVAQQCKSQSPRHTDQIVDLGWFDQQHQLDQAG
jgi:hypothetical protein